MGKVSLYPATNISNDIPENPLPSILKTPAGLALLEIQGTLNSTIPQGNDDEGQPEIPIGELSFPLYDAEGDQKDTAWQKRVHLYVGDNQRLTGELKKLPHPIAVIRKRPVAELSTSEGLEVVEILYYKLFFSHRPEPFGVVAVD